MFKLVAIFGIVLCSAMLFPPALNLIVDFGEKAAGMGQDRDIWTELVTNQLLGIILFFGAILLISIKKLTTQIETRQLFKNRTFQISSVMLVLVPLIVGQREKPIIIFQTIFTVILLLGTFVLVFLNLYAKRRDFYETFVRSLLFCLLFIFLSTEILSFLSLLNFGMVLTVWLLFFGVQLFIYLSKNRGVSVDFPQTISFNFQARVLLLILALTFFIAVIYPPNNYDSMTYHIPRVEHWIQNGSVEHYETSNLRQTKFAPFSGFIITHGRILSGGNSLMNLTQWFAFVFSLVVIYRILNIWGVDKAKRIYGVLFFATTPMAILQASSTQTDLTLTFFILLLVERFLTWKKNVDLFTAFEFGVALGLAALTKGTAYPLALIVVVFFAIIALKHFRKRMVGAVLAALVAFSINFPHYSRNYTAYGEPLGNAGGERTMSDLGLNSFLASFPAHIYINCGIPIPKKLFSDLSSKYYKILKIDASKRFPYGVPESNSIISFVFFHEDGAKNFIQMLLVLALGAIFIVNKKYRRYQFYTAIVATTWLVFMYCIPWQPWITRLQLPLFALFAPIFGIWYSQTERKKTARTILGLMLLISLLPLTQNQFRPVIKSLHSDRFELIFNNRGKKFHENYKNAISEIDNLKTKRLGIITENNAWEYPLFAYNWKNTKPHITHILSEELEEIDENIDVLFVLERFTPEIENITGKEAEFRKPFVLKRSKSDNKWEVIYSPF